MQYWLLNQAITALNWQIGWRQAHEHLRYTKPDRIAFLWQQKKCYYMHHLRSCLCVCIYTHHNKDSFHHFWTATTFPLRKLSRWVWNMQQFVWSLRCLFRTAFACNYNKLGSMPCHWCIPFVLRSNFLFLREKSCHVFF